MARVTLGLLAAGVAVGQDLPYPNRVESILLTDAAATKGAVCLDGTPQRIWVQAASSPASSNKWTIHLQGESYSAHRWLSAGKRVPAQLSAVASTCSVLALILALSPARAGGGWCESIDDCAGRAFTYLGSSNTAYYAQQAPDNGITGKSDFNASMELAYIPSCLGARWCGGLMVNSSTTNAVTSDWNKVFVRYCNGFSYAGNNETVTPAVHAGAPVNLYFRGARIFDAVVEYLIAQRSLGSATNVILSGDSAGGLATFWHVDRLAELLPAATVVGAPDSGYFLADVNYPAWPAALRRMVALTNASGIGGGLNSACVAARVAAGSDPADCALPEIVTPHIASRLFVINSQYDPALDSISGGIGGGDAAGVTRLAGILRNAVAATVLTRQGNAAFITSCAQHCGQWAQHQVLGNAGNPNQFDDFSPAAVRDAGPAVSAMDAFAAWYASSSTAAPAMWLQNATYPCATCCSGAGVNWREPHTAATVAALPPALVSFASRLDAASR